MNSYFAVGSVSGSQTVYFYLGIVDTVLDVLLCDQDIERRN